MMSECEGVGVLRCYIRGAMRASPMQEEEGIRDCRIIFEMGSSSREHD